MSSGPATAPPPAARATPGPPGPLGPLGPLGAEGRMALSNYLLQSLVCTTLFYSYGLGLFGRVGPAPGILLALAIYLLQIPLSGWWLARYRFGPAEWLWRSLTYGRAQPMKRDAVAVRRAADGT